MRDMFSVFTGLDGESLQFTLFNDRYALFEEQLHVQSMNLPFMPVEISRGKDSPEDVATAIELQVQLCPDPRDVYFVVIPPERLAEALFQGVVNHENVSVDKDGLHLEVNKPFLLDSGRKVRILCMHTHRLWCFGEGYPEEGGFAFLDKNWTRIRVRQPA